MVKQLRSQILISIRCKRRRQEGLEHVDWLVVRQSKRLVNHPSGGRGRDGKLEG